MAAEEPAEEPAAVTDTRPGARPYEPLLTNDEAESVIGPLSRVTAIPSPGGYGTSYRGRDGSLLLTVNTGRAANLSLTISRRTGRQVPGLGDAAWLLNKDRTVVFRHGMQVAKITVTGQRARPSPDLLTSLAATVATRLGAAPVTFGY
jgi:hypothetical protein